MYAPPRPIARGSDPSLKPSSATPSEHTAGPHPDGLPSSADPAGPDTPSASTLPLASIVIPVYNTRPYLRECIDSALAQAYPNTEVIAVDDGSTDGSLDLLAEYGDAIRTVASPHGGISSALNAGIRAMSGEWFKRLDSDDILYPHAVSALVAAAHGAAAAAHGAAAAARGLGPARLIPYGDTEEIGEDGSLLGRPLPSPSNHLTTAQQGAMMLDVPYGLPSASLIHRSAFDDIGMFDERYRIGEDVELNLRLTVRGGCRMLHVPGALYRYRRRAGQATAGSIALARGLRRVARDCWAGMDPARRAEYAAEYKRLLHAKLFLYGAWACANRGRSCGAPDAASLPGGTAAAAAAAGRDGRRRWLPRLAYNAMKARTVRPCLHGWAYAARNPDSELVARCRGVPINSCTNIMRLGFAPAGEGGLDAAGLPRMIVPWEAEGGGAKTPNT